MLVGGKHVSSKFEIFLSIFVTTCLLYSGLIKPCDVSFFLGGGGGGREGILLLLFCWCWFVF